jgi:hypothetical protein
MAGETCRFPFYSTSATAAAGTSQRQWTAFWYLFPLFPTARKTTSTTNKQLQQPLKSAMNGDDAKKTHLSNSS